MAFLAAAVTGPLARATALDALATARREVAAPSAEQDSIVVWVQSEIRLRGIRESAAVLATMEADINRHVVAEAYRRNHLDHAELVDQMLAALDDGADPAGVLGE